MKKIEFKKISAQNFFCFGNKGIELYFNKYSNVVLVQGKNLDTSSKTGNDIASNGSGKSSIPEIIVYGFYGKTVKKPKKLSHKDIINNKTGKKLKIEIEWDKYKLIRSRKPDGLRLWESEVGIWDDSTEITLGGMPATQEKIENILGLSYESFVNIAIFTDNNSVSFLECDAAEKRIIVENLLSLEKFRKYQDTSKKLLKICKDESAVLLVEQRHIEQNISNNQGFITKYKKDIENYKKSALCKYKDILENIKTTETDINDIENNDNELIYYQNEQSKLEKIDFDINDIEVVRDKIEFLIDKAIVIVDNSNKEIDDINIDVQQKKTDKLQFENILQNLTSSINRIEKLEEGVVCNHCLSVIFKENYASVLEKNKKEFEEFKNSCESAKTELSQLLSNLKEKTNKKNSLAQILALQQDKLKTLNKKHGDLIKQKTNIVNIKKPDSELKVSGMKEKVKILKEEALKNDPEKLINTPFDSYLKESEFKLEELQNDNIEIIAKINDIKSEFKYYEYWGTAFGDQGIRKYIIDGIVPSLNDNLAYWLGILIDNNLRIKFDNQFEDYIDKLPEESQLSYFAISGGQKRRINLALSQAFAHIMSLNSGTYLNLVFLDEVTSNIDKIGAESIYKMIMQLAQDKQVFITTHDQNLLELLKGCETINLVLENGESKLEN